MSVLPPSRYFPPATEARDDGLLAVGGELDVDWLLDAYRHGIFPWPVDDGLLAWWSPDPRAVLELDALCVSRRLARTCRGGRFTISHDRDFAGVIHGCKTAQGRASATWITDDMEGAYIQLHAHGFAHSVEVWNEGQLAGGLYGVALGAAFFAESMFYQVRDASKVALVHLVEHLRASGFRLLDVQQWTPHMASFGATEIQRNVFLTRLASALCEPVVFAGDGD